MNDCQKKRKGVTRPYIHCTYPVLVHLQYSMIQTARKRFYLLPRKHREANVVSGQRIINNARPKERTSFVSNQVSIGVLHWDRTKSASKHHTANHKSGHNQTTYKDRKSLTYSFIYWFIEVRKVRNRWCDVTTLCCSCCCYSLLESLHSVSTVLTSYK